MIAVAISNEFPIWYLCHLYFPPKFCFYMILWHYHLALFRKQSTPHCESSIGDDGMICKTQQRHINSFNKTKVLLFDVIKIEIKIYKKNMPFGHICLSYLEMKCPGFPDKQYQKFH